MRMKARIIQEEVLVRVLEDPPFRGSLYIPRTARSSLQLGVVKQNNTDLPLVEGDVVAFKNYTGRPFPSLEGEEGPLWLLRKQDVEAKLG